MLCESAFANVLQNNAIPKYYSSEATIIQRGFGNLPRKALKEIPKLKEVFEDFSLQ